LVLPVVGRILRGAEILQLGRSRPARHGEQHSQDRQRRRNPRPAEGRP
jgi:hypothetical protein